MNHRLAIFITILLMGAATSALADELDDVLETIREKTAKVTAFQGDYSETTRDLEFEMDRTKTGTLAIKKTTNGDEWLMHLVQQTPFEQHVYVTPTQAVRYEPDNKIAHVVALDPSRDRSAIQRSIDLLSGPNALRDKYQMTLDGTEKVGDVTCWRIHLTPLADDVETDFKKLTLWVDTELGIPRKAEGLEHGETSLRTFELDKIQINPTLSDDEFIFTPPAGVDVDHVQRISY